MTAPRQHGEPAEPTDHRPWLDELRDAAAHVRSIRDRLRTIREIDPEAEEWGRLSVAEELVTSSSSSLAELSPPEASMIAAWERATREEATSNRGTVDIVTTPADERAALLDDLLPRIDEALDEALAGLSDAELRALASHPDPVAALVLVAGLASRAESPGSLDAAAGAEAPPSAAALPEA